MVPLNVAYLVLQTSTFISIIIIIVIRVHLFRSHRADQMPGYHEMGQLLEHRSCLDTQ